jgi:hypothetical protein
LDSDRDFPKPITVLVPYSNEEGRQELYCTGFLTSDHHAMYIEDAYRDIIFVGVLPSRDPGVYIDVTGYLSLGKIAESQNLGEVVAELTERLKQMSAYQFLADVVISMRDEVEFDETIIPGILKG